MTLVRVEVSAGAVLVCAALYYLDDSGAALWVLLACACHELGHCAAIRALGGRVRRLRLSCAGAELKLSGARPLSTGGMLLAALAGPMTNLALALGSAALARRGMGERLYFFAGLNLGLAAFNLLPAAWLDGGRAVECVFSAAGRAEQGRRITQMCSAAVAGALLLAGGALLWKSGGRNFTLLLAGVWMLWWARREKKL